MSNNEVVSKSVLICRAYNAGLADVFEQLAEQQEPEYFDVAENIELIQRETLNAVASWFDKPLDEVAMSPAQFFDGLNTTADLLAAYDVFAANCDQLLPEYFQIRLGKAAEALLPELHERALSLPLDSLDDAEHSERFAIQCVSLDLLGQWQYTALAEPLLEQIQSSALIHERFAAAIKEYFRHAGVETIPALQTAIEKMLNQEVQNPNLDYLLVYLTEFGKDQPADDIYQILRKAFKQMKEKIIPVICLGDYGDGRAVPMLRAFVEQNSQDLDRATLAETLSSIKRLGGEITDLRY